MAILIKKQNYEQYMKKLCILNAEMTELISCKKLQEKELERLGMLYIQKLLMDADDRLLANVRECGENTVKIVDYVYYEDFLTELVSINGLFRLIVDTVAFSSSERNALLHIAEDMGILLKSFEDEPIIVLPTKKKSFHQRRHQRHKRSRFLSQVPIEGCVY